jgi:hypothetical protein
MDSGQRARATWGAVGTITNTIAIVSIAVPLVIGITLYSVWANADWENSTHHPDGTVTIP